MPEKKNWFALADLFVAIAGFGLAMFCEKQWMGPAAPHSEWWVFTWLLSALVAWMVLFPVGQSSDGFRFSFDGLLAVMGSNLLVQCTLLFLFGIRSVSWLVIVLGSAITVGLNVLVHSLVLDRRRPRFVFLGADRITAPLAGQLNGDVAGGIDESAAQLPAGMQYLGKPEALAEVCAAEKPDMIILGGDPARAPLRELLELHYAGIETEASPSLYESMANRVAWQQTEPSDLLFFLNPNLSPAMTAFQAVYKNLLGLTLRIIFAPLMILTSLLIMIVTRGPALERIECLGFQRIPFQMLRFRIYRADGTASWIGRLISRLHLTDLPQLINVVRGEMSLFGPAPVRTAFAHRLSEWMPAYEYRFTVKPGIFGWSRANLDMLGRVADEASILELDLYYVKQESPSLDLDILMRMLFRSPARKRPAELAAAAGK